MSVKQIKIISLLLEAAKQSEQSTQVAAAICRGGKILAISVNTHRNKYGAHVRCSGHAEIACLYKLFPNTFKHKIKGSYV